MLPNAPVHLPGGTREATIPQSRHVPPGPVQRLVRRLSLGHAEFVERLVNFGMDSESPSYPYRIAGRKSIKSRMNSAWKSSSGTWHWIKAT